MRERLVLHAVPESPRLARKFVLDLAAGWGYHAVLSDAQLLTSEVVTNAVLHAGDRIEIEVADLDDRLLVAVADPARDREPQLRDAKPTDPTGRGLALVNSVAADWGVAPGPDDGKVFWFTLPR